MKEELVSFATAVLAKEKGFEWRSEARYGTQTSILYNDAVINDLEDDVFTAAPTQSLLQKWLREKHNIDVVISPERYSNGVNYLVQAQKWDLTADPEVHLNFVVKGSFWYNDNHEYPTYESALEKGLQEALKLIEV